MNHLAFIEFFEISCEATSRLAVDVLRLADRRIMNRTIVRMLTTAPRDETELASLEFFEDSFCCQCLTDAWSSLSQHGTCDDKAMYWAARHYFLHVVPQLSPESRRLLEGAFRGAMSGLRYAEEVSRGSDEGGAAGVVL